MGIVFLTNLDVNLLLNFDFASFVYSHRSRGIASEHWLIDIRLPQNNKLLKGGGISGHKQTILDSLKFVSSSN